MDVYNELNKMLKYIEDNIEGDISYKKLASFLGCSVYTLERVFSLLCNITLKEYIKNRKLINSVRDLTMNRTIEEIAAKYGYSSGTTFSRAFYRFHKSKPSDIKRKRSNIVITPMLMFKQTDNKKEEVLDFKIEKKDKLTLYGIKEEIKNNNGPEVAVRNWINIKKQYEYFNDLEKRYGIVEYKDKKIIYWCASEKEEKDFEKIVIPRSNWVIFKFNNFNGKKIKKISDLIETKYLPSMKMKDANSYVVEIYYKDYIEICFIYN